MVIYVYHITELQYVLNHAIHSRILLLQIERTIAICKRCKHVQLNLVYIYIYSSLASGQCSASCRNSTSRSKRTFTESGHKNRDPQIRIEANNRSIAEQCSVFHLGLIKSFVLARLQMLKNKNEENQFGLSTQKNTARTYTKQLLGTHYTMWHTYVFYLSSVSGYLDEIGMLGYGLYS